MWIQPHRQRQAPMAPHGDDHQRHGKREFRNQTLAAQGKSGVTAGLFLLPCIVFVGFRRKICRRETQRTDFVLHLPDELFRADTMFGQIRPVRNQQGGASGQIHGNGRHSRHGSERPLRTRGAGRTAHAVNTKTHALHVLVHNITPFFLTRSCQAPRSALVYQKFLCGLRPPP